MVDILPPILVIVIVAKNQFHAVPGTLCLGDSFVNRRKEFLLQKLSGFIITRFGASNYGNKCGIFRSAVSWSHGLPKSAMTSRKGCDDKSGPGEDKENFYSL